MTPSGRFAPTPSGWLHLGNARTALVAWLSARAQGGRFVLRIEDLDGPRTVSETVVGNLVELRWLGLDWDEGPDIGGAHAPYLQSARSDHYQAALAVLQSRDEVFRCYLSRRELRRVASAPHGKGPVYGPRERALNTLQAPEKRARGKSPSLRYRVPDIDLTFDDGFAGLQQAQATDEVGDIVLRRADGVWAYQFAVVLDDSAMGISEVVRGDDLIPSTFSQLLLYRALDLPPPRFVHIPLLLDTAGERLAKRKGSLTLESLRARGVAPERVVGLLANTLGLTDTPEPTSPHHLIPRFDLTRLVAEPRALTPDLLAGLTAAGD